MVTERIPRLRNGTDNERLSVRSINSVATSIRRDRPIRVRATPARSLVWALLAGGDAQATAVLMSARTFFSTAGVQSMIAKTTGHIGCSSSVAASSNPKTA